MAWIKFDKDKPVTVRFLDGFEFEQRRNRWDKIEYVYDVNDGDKMSASEYLHRLIMEAADEHGLGAGSRLVITKIRRDDKYDWTVEVPEQLRMKEVTRTPFEPKAERSESERRKLWEELVMELGTCLVAARELCEAELSDYSNEDVRAMAATLMIQADRQGVKIPKG